MIKNIVFDFGGVIVDYTPENIIKAYTDDSLAIDKLSKELFGSQAWEMFDAGIISQEQVEAVVKGNVYSHLRPLVSQILDSWYEHLPPYPIEGLIEELKEKGYGIYLLSNASVQFEKYQANIPALKLFDGLYVSGYHKMLKPSYSIYKDFLNEFTLKPEECLFIDDKAENIEGAQAIKMTGIVHNGDVDQLEAKLKEEGLL